MRRTGTRNRRNGTHGERAPTVHIYEPLKSEHMNDRKYFFIEWFQPCVLRVGGPGVGERVIVAILQR